MVVLSRQVPGRHGVLLDLEQRLAGRAVEHEQESGLGGDGHGLDRPAVAHDLDQRGLRRQVPVPQVVVDGLEMPAAAAGPAVERDEAVAEQVRSGAVASVVVIRGRSERHVRQSQLLVHAGHGPQVRAAALLPRIAAPGLVAELARAGNRMKPPAQLAGVDVEAAHVTAGPARHTVRDAAADDQCPGALRDGRCQAIAAGRILRQLGRGGSQDAAVAESGIQAAGLAVDRE